MMIRIVTFIGVLCCVSEALAQSQPAQAGQPPLPCKNSPEYHQFDFWIGEWNVFDPQGNRVGTNLIQQVSEECAILENWSSARCLTGKSINFYDPVNEQWHQYWMGANGYPQRYSGVYRDGAMRYEGEPVVKDGKTVLSRLTFFNIDSNTVRQLKEQSTDNGNTWNVSYDFKYVRKK